MGNSGKSKISEVKIKLPIYCCVKNCKSSSNDKNKNICFHHFPKEKERKVAWLNRNEVVEFVDRRRAWAINLRINKRTLRKTPIVCSRHFKDDDYIILSPTGNVWTIIIT